MRLSILVLAYVLVLQVHFTKADDEVVHFKIVDEGRNIVREPQALLGVKRHNLKYQQQQPRKHDSINTIKTRIMKKKKSKKSGDHSCGELDPTIYTPAVVLNIELKNICNLGTIEARDVVKAIEKGISTMEKGPKISPAMVEVNKMVSSNNDCCYERTEDDVVSYDEDIVEIVATIHYSKMNLDMLTIDEDKITKELNKKLCEKKDSCSTVTFKEPYSMLNVIGSTGNENSIIEDTSLSISIDSSTVGVMSASKEGRKIKMTCGKLSSNSVAPVAVIFVELENTCCNTASIIDSKDLVKAIEKGFKEKKSIAIEINSLVTSDDGCYDSRMQDGVQFSPRDSSVVREDSLTTIIVTIHSYITDFQLIAIDESKITKELNKKFCGNKELCSSVKVEEPSNQPSVLFSSSPSQSSMPSFSPSKIPSPIPSQLPSYEPSKSPSEVPSFTPSTIPSISPSVGPSSLPTVPPSSLPSTLPSSTPSDIPSGKPTGIPSSLPSNFPSSLPSSLPSLTPSNTPSSKPSDTKFDVMILVDGSGSLGSSGFDEEKQKVIEIVNAVPLQFGSRIGIILFYTELSTTIIHGLDGSQDKSDILNAVESMVWSGGWTSTREALEVAVRHYRSNEDGNELALYILSDGNPQSSSSSAYNPNICIGPDAGTVVNSLIDDFEELNPFRYFLGFGDGYTEDKYRCVFGDNIILGNDLDMCIHSPFSCIDDA